MAVIEGGDGLWHDVVVFVNDHTGPETVTADLTPHHITNHGLSAADAIIAVPRLAVAW